MNIHQMPFIDNATSQTEIYTNLQGLQSIKTEESHDAALKKISQQFESLFVNMMMKSMRSANAVFEENNPFTSEEGKFYRDMLDQQRAQSFSHGRGFGIADAMYRQLSRNYGEGGGDSKVDNKSRENESLNTAPPARDSSKSFNRGGGVSRVNKVEKSLPFDGDPKTFVNELLPMAKNAAKEIGVDHLVLIAQSALETGWGKHIVSGDQGQSSNNLFNIKEKNPDSQPSAWVETLEFIGGVFQKEKAAFKVYQNLSESFNDYVKLIDSSERYYAAKDQAHDPKQYMTALQNSGYATDPKYSEKVMSVYERVTAIADSLEASGSML